MLRRTLVVLALFAGTTQLSAHTLASALMVPAAAHTGGSYGTFWRTDVSIHNPHAYDLPVVVQILESHHANWSVPTLDLVLYPWETYNLWDALGPDLFDLSGTGAILVYVEPSFYDQMDADGGGHFLVTSRTYTPDPLSEGEFGQTVPGRRIDDGMDWWTFGYAAGILNDGAAFRCNIGVASWTAAETVVQVDVQDAAGEILATEILTLPAFSHVQRRLSTPVSGGSLVFYLVDGPEDALVFPYGSIADRSTSDPSFQPATPSAVGVDWQRKARPEAAPPARREPPRPARDGRDLESPPRRPRS